jgi:predicted signal transduction protein with EAL and GGDEF domain
MPVELVAAVVMTGCMGMGLAGIRRGRVRLAGPFAAALVASLLWTGAWFFDALAPFDAEATASGVRGVALAVLAVSIGSYSWLATGRDLVPALDGIVLAVGVGAIWVVYVLEPGLPDLSRPAAVGETIAAVGAVALVGAVGHVLTGGEVHRSVVSRWLVVAGLAAAGSEALHQVLETDGESGGVTVPAALLAVLAAVSLAKAAWHPELGASLDARTRTRLSTGLGRIAVVSVGALCAPTMVAADVLTGVEPHLLVGLTAAFPLIALIMLRTALLVRRLERQAERLEQRAGEDPVTGLGNRALLVSRVERLLASSEPTGTLVAVDVGRATELRDALGARIADEVLRLVGTRLSAGLGAGALADQSGPLVSRVAPATFAVLLPAVRTPEHALAVTRGLLAACEPALAVSGLTLQVDASAAVLVLPDDGASPEELLDHAEVALSVAPDAPGRIVRYSRGLGSAGEVSPSLVVELPGALARGELELYFQPQVRVATGRVVGAEALVRWRHPVHGLLPPIAFIPVAERTGIIVQITAYVLDRALAQCAQWRHDGMEISVAVNLSGHDLLDPDLVTHVEHALSEHAVPANSLELEVTETMALVDPRRAAATLAALARLGVALSVDDFGTGYSSLSYLRRLPVGRLKIDRSFVGEMLVDDASRAIVASTVDLAGRLGLEVVAEGVEDDATMTELELLGCDVAQGYYLGRPVPAGELPALVHALDARAATHAPIGLFPVPRRSGTRG